MRAEFSHFGFEAPAADGVFFALFPSEDAAAQLARTAQQLCIRHRLNGRVFAPERFHVSLLGFGAHAGLPPDSSPVRSMLRPQSRPRRSK